MVAMSSWNERHYYTADNEEGSPSLNRFGNPHPVFPDSDATESSIFSYYNGLYNISIDMQRSIW